MRCFILIWLLLIFLVSCRDFNNATLQTRHYYTYSLSDSALPPTEVNQILHGFRDIGRPTLVSAEKLMDNWTMEDKLAGEPPIAVSLPHSFSKPDYEIWYHTHCHLSGPGIIQIIADDGAQLFISGNKVTSTGTMFPITDTGEVKLTVRVMNNAMSGGLKRVTFYPAQAARKYERSLSDYHRLKRIVAKLERIEGPSTETLQTIQAALENPNDETIAKAEASVSSYPLLIGPVVQFIDNTKITISVLAEDGVPVKLRWGTSENSLPNQIVNEGPVVHFEVAIPGNISTFFYSVSCKEFSQPVNLINMSRGDKFSFNVWADSQSGWDSFEKNMLNNTMHDDAFGIGVGDLVGSGWDDEEWVTFFNLLSIDGAEKPYFLVPGNHDYDGYYDSLISHNYHRFTGHAHPYYSWRYQNCAFIALDPNVNFPIGVPALSEQHNWLLNELEKDSWKSATWKFILVHQPPYSQGWEGYHGEMVLREFLEPIIEKNKIDFLISGHTHDYERLTRYYGEQKTTFFIVGGAGGSVEPPASSTYPKMDTLIKTHHMGRFFIEGKKAVFKLFDLENVVVDSVTFTK